MHLGLHLDLVLFVGDALHVLLDVVLDHAPDTLLRVQKGAVGREEQDMEALVVLPDAIGPVHPMVVDHERDWQWDMLGLELLLQLDQEVRPAMLVGTGPDLELKMVEAVADGAVDGHVREAQSVVAALDGLIRVLPGHVQGRFSPRVPAGLVGEDHRFPLDQE